MARTTCSKCGGVKDGSHHSYCLVCCREYRKAHRRTECYDCGGAMTGADSTRCKACRAKKPTDRRVYGILYRYNLTEADYTDMLKNQEYKCRICSKDLIVGSRGKDGAAVDHCHESGVVRGMLCYNCNRGLGMFEDNSDLLLSAALYLESFKETNDTEGVV